MDKERLLRENVQSFVAIKIALRTDEGTGFFLVPLVRNTSYFLHTHNFPGQIVGFAVTPFSSLLARMRNAARSASGAG